MTLRLKLTIGSIVVILVANALFSLATVVYLERVWLEEVQTRVRMNLNSAEASYRNQLAGIGVYLRAAAAGRALTDAAGRHDRPAIDALLVRLQNSGGMDILLLTDASGRVVARGQNPRRTGDDLSADPVLARAIAQNGPASGTLLLSIDRLAAEGDALADRARVELQSTAAARPTGDKVRQAGMALAAAVPVLDAEGKRLGVLYAADLLNRRNSLVDAIQREVFPDETYQGRPIGTVTIFQDDLRIATNVVSDDGARAIGTRVSKEVADRVLGEGRTWDGRAFVVSDWYYAAYRPIRDPDDRVIGALYVGLLEEPFVARGNAIMLVVIAMAVVATLACLLLMHFVATLVLRPISRVVAMSQRVIEGDSTARIGIRPPGEMGLLCQAVDRMADSLAQREEELKTVTRQQIGRTEKMASIGRLAAGVAHEINNPLTGVLTFACLMREKPNMDEQDQQDLDLIIQETTRVAEIVRNLLDFARERAEIKERLDINDVIQRTVRLIRNQKSFDRIVIEEKLTEDLPPVDGSRNQLQQVLLNLALNACEAMPDGGRLTIFTYPRNGRVAIDVTDTGIGIKPEHLEQIFEPFFTTKPVGKGTGLGLSVSYGIVEQHGGTLEVESKLDRGTKFTIVLPGAVNWG